MKPIKFRAWYKNENLMLTIAEITFHKDGDVLAFPLTREAVSSYLIGDNVVLMQFTGLLDKNGREIYEGDIVEREEKNYEVVRDEQYLEYAIYGEGGQYKMDVGLKVVLRGNIYENPELINR